MKQRTTACPFLVRLEIFVLGTTLFLLTNSCAQVGRLLRSTDPYHTKTYKKVCDEWTREARIYRGLKVELIVSATFKSGEFRRAYAEEYAEAYKLTPEEKEHFIKEECKSPILTYDFVVASFVPDEKYDDFDKTSSMWKLYLMNDQDERVIPVEVSRRKRKDALSPHFFPYVTPWKSVFHVSFPQQMPEGKGPIIKDNTKAIRLVITSVLGTAEMAWTLESS